jgi:hypothetical protein
MAIFWKKVIWDTVPTVFAWYCRTALWFFFGAKFNHVVLRVLEYWHSSNTMAIFWKKVIWDTVPMVLAWYCHTALWLFFGTKINHVVLRLLEYWH